MKTHSSNRTLCLAVCLLSAASPLSALALTPVETTSVLYMKQEEKMARDVGDPAALGMFTKIPRFFTVRTPTRGWRLGILGNARERLVVGLDCSEMNTELGRLRTGFLLSLPLALALIGLGGWLVAGQAVRPLRSIARAAEQMTARGLDQRIPVSREDSEIDRLITVLNRMMDRLQASFRQATRFSADASHELKTPWR